VELPGEAHLFGAGRGVHQRRVGSRSLADGLQRERSPAAQGGARQVGCYGVQPGAETRHRGIVLNTVNPGPTDNGGYPREMIEDTGSFPQGRWGKPEDAARLVGWLCTDEAQWVVGQRS
jgi:NAD(P)-dependent dehydrogenase (short-subunit alcohol dehydrogenase family)